MSEWRYIVEDPPEIGALVEIKVAVSSFNRTYRARRTSYNNYDEEGRTSRAPLSFGHKTTKWRPVRVEGDVEGEEYEDE